MNSTIEVPKGGTMARMKDPPTLNLYFPEKGKVQPKGFTGVTVDETVTVVVKGKLTRVEHSADQWDPGKRIGVKISSCEIQGPVKKMSLDSALSKAKKTV